LAAGAARTIQDLITRASRDRKERLDHQRTTACAREGWILLAGIMLVFAGILNSIWGIAAIDDSAYWGKAGWMVFVIVVPFLGVFLYLIGQHDEMRNRNLAQARSETEAFDEDVRDTAGGPAKELLDKDAITQEEFDVLNAKAMA
jgi:hypothetical protein